jgi:hypothetical protein
MLEKLRNKPIVINSDLDGIMSGLLLKKYLNCSIVGFTNSAETVWLNERLCDDYSELCFVDIFITNPDTITIDQHIISVNEQHHNLLEKNSNKINPNLLNPRFHLPNSSYKTKYPFGTVHFIIALFEKMGIEIDSAISEVNPHKLCCIDFILRADDAMKTTVDSKYVDNAADWWNWLKELSNDGKTTNGFIDYLGNTTPKKAKELKKRIGDILKKDPYYCDTSDGGIHEITTKENFLKTSVIAYFKIIASLMHIELFDVESPFKIYAGVSERMSLTQKQRQELIESNTIDGKKLFSYAFVRTSGRAESFSATYFQKNS